MERPVYGVVLHVCDCNRVKDASMRQSAYCMSDHVRHHNRNGDHQNRTDNVGREDPLHVFDWGEQRPTHRWSPWQASH